MYQLRIFQKGFNFSQDGPGNRLVYHLQGCNLRCPWCSNPEGLSLQGGTRMPVEAVLAEAVRSSPMFFDGGGVTLTGGEVTMQLDGVKELLAGLKAEGIHTAIETNGLSPRLEELFPLVDVLMIDCKHYDPEKHRAVTGRDNRILFENLERALAYGLAPAVRIPLIGGFNAAPEDGDGFARRLCEVGLRERGTVELLPYHEYGRDKYRTMGLPYTMTEQAKVSEETVRTISRQLSASGLRVVRT